MHSRLNHIIGYIVFFVIFIFLQYIEGFPPIGGLSIAQLWKMFVLLWFFYILYKYDRKWFPFEKISYLCSILCFMCPAIISDPFSIVIHASKQLPLVLFFHYWMVRYSERQNVLETVLYSLAQYISILSLVCLLGVVHPIVSYKSADAYGESMEYYSALFGAVHAASSYFCIALFILLYGFKQGHFVKKTQKVYNVFLIVVLLLSLYKSFVRTGWLMFGMGCFFMFFNKKDFTVKKILRYGIILGLVIMGVGWLFLNNTSLRARITEQTVYNKSGSAKIDGSGRFTFWTISLTKYMENDAYGLLFGKGIGAAKDDMADVLGHRLVSHNHFIDTLAQYGIVGLLLLLGYFYAIYRFIVKYGRGSPYQQLSKIIFMAYVIFAFFQNEMYFWYAAMFAVSLALMYMSSSQDSIK